MQADRHARDRAEKRDINKIKTKIEKSKDPIGHLKEAVVSINGEYGFNIEPEYLDRTIDELRKNKAISLNPCAFVLGRFILIHNEIDQDRLNNVCTNNRYTELLERHFVDKIDIIRYARFWLKIFKMQNEK